MNMPRLFERFIRHVTTGPGCWNWAFGKDHYGYGVLRFNKKLYKAHRLAWFFFRGNPGNLHILHACDNPACVNPAHMRLGTFRDNMQDKFQKKRHAWGERSGGSKLKTNDVYDIRQLLHQGDLSQRQIARKYGVDDSLISHIKHGRNWALLEA